MVILPSIRWTERARAGGTTNGSGSELVAVLIIERRARSTER